MPFHRAAVTIPLSLMWSFDTLPLNGLRLDPKSPAGMALEKATDALILLFATFVLCRIFGISLGSVYLQSGNLKVALIFGILGFAVMASFGIFQARSLAIGIQKIRTWTP